MAIRHITVLFEGNDNEQSAIRAALELGKAHGAHVRCLHLQQDPQVLSYLSAEGLPAYAEALAKDMEKENHVRAARARREFLAAVRSKDIAYREDDASHPQGASSSFAVFVGNLKETVARECKYTDLLVLERKWDNYNLEYDEAMFSAIFETAKPVLFIPSRFHNDISNVLAVAWNESNESAHALAAAMPFLEKAQGVHILSVAKNNAAYESAERLKKYLQMHKVEAEISLLEKESTPIGDTLLEKARSLNTTMLVMGAYGHTRVREALFGGVTRHMLEKTDMPVLMMH